MSRDFAGRPIIRNLEFTPPKKKPLMVKVQSESDFDNYDKVRDESPGCDIKQSRFQEYDIDLIFPKVRRIR